MEARSTATSGQEAAAAKAKGIPMENAASCEEDVYEMNGRWLAAAGAVVHSNPDTKLLPAVLFFAFCKYLEFQVF
jgi:hypothetical protein